MKFRRSLQRHEEAEAKTPVAKDSPEEEAAEAGSTAVASLVPEARIRQTNSVSSGRNTFLTVGPPTGMNEKHCIRAMIGRMANPYHSWSANQNE